MAADQNARERLVQFLDEEAFDPILRTSVDRYSGNDQDKLEHVKAATERTKQRYHQWPNSRSRPVPPSSMSSPWPPNSQSLPSSPLS
jgi:hypothetical protein